MKNNYLDRIFFPLFIVFLFFSFTSCSPKVKKTNSLVVCSPHPVEFISVLVRNFENETGIDVQVIPQGTGEILENLSKSQNDDIPYCDVMWGGSLSTVAPSANLFENYTSVNESHFDSVYRNVEGCLTRFSDIPSVLMINRNLLGDIQVEGYKDLLNPALKGKIAFADPEKSSSSWEHLLNMLSAMNCSDTGWIGIDAGGTSIDTGASGTDSSWTYVRDLCENLDGKLLPGSKSVYEGVSSGEYAVGLTFEEGGANYAENDINIQLVYMKEGVVFTPDGIYIVKGTDKRKQAEQFVDYLTGKDVQTYISQVMNRRSVRVDVEEKSFLQPRSQLKILTVDYGKAATIKEESLRRFAECYSGVNF